MEKVSVYIPTYNSAKYIARCIESILKQTYPIEEIIVVDDNSQDETRDIASKFPVKLISHKHNKGIAAARNTAISEAKGNFIAAIDADCLITPSWLQECMKNFDNPKVAAVGGKLIEEHSDRVEYRWRRAHLKHHWGDKQKINPIFLSGSNIVIKKEIFKEVGFYDEIRFTKNYEDVDLSLKLRKKGFNLIYEPNAMAKHIKYDTFMSILQTYWSWMYHDYKSKYISRLIFNFINTTKIILNDIIKGNFELIFIDMLTYPFCSYFDFKKYIGA